MNFSLPSDPHLRRWMLFVDGENFTIRAQNVAVANHIQLVEGSHFSRDVFVWLPGVPATAALTNSDSAPILVQSHAIRSYYYTSACGDEVKLRAIRTSLHNIGFQPCVFKKKASSQKTKGVDISLATDLLSNAYHDNLDVAVLVAGDGDFVPLVTEVKRLGKLVYIAFFAGTGNGLNADLELVSDRFFDFTSTFLQRWS